MVRRMMGNSNKSVYLFYKRFFPAGDYTWEVPNSVTSVDVFLVGGGGDALVPDGVYKGGGGSGYTKTFKKSNEGVKQGEAISVKPGQLIPLYVGQGGYYQGSHLDGEASWFLDATYLANGGKGGTYTDINSTTSYVSGDGGSGGGGSHNNAGASAFGVGGSDGGNGKGGNPGKGQGYTTRDFGEDNLPINAGGGGGEGRNVGASDYHVGVWDYGFIMYNHIANGGGYGAGGSGISSNAAKAGDGTVLIRYEQPCVLNKVESISFNKDFYLETEISISNVIKNAQIILEFSITTDSTNKMYLFSDGYQKTYNSPTVSITVENGYLYIYNYTVSTKLEYQLEKNKKYKFIIKPNTKQFVILGTLFENDVQLASIETPSFGASYKSGRPIVLGICDNYTITKDTAFTGEIHSFELQDKDSNSLYKLDFYHNGTEYVSYDYKWDRYMLQTKKII